MCKFHLLVLLLPLSTIKRKTSNTQQQLSYLHFLIQVIQVLETTSKRKGLKNEIKYQRTEDTGVQNVIHLICIAYKKKNLVPTSFF